MLLLVGVLGFFTLIIIMAKLGRASASSDPNLDPLLNPNIRVGKNWWQVAIWSFFLCVLHYMRLRAASGKGPAVQRQPKRGSSSPNFQRVALIFSSGGWSVRAFTRWKKKRFFAEVWGPNKAKINSDGDQVQKDHFSCSYCFVLGGSITVFMIF